MSEQSSDKNDPPVYAYVSPERVVVRLQSGVEVSTPLWWYPRLHDASPAQRMDMELMPDGIHWPQVDEDLSIRGMIAGIPAPGAVPPYADAAE